MDFNENQRKAISTVEGPLITVACPGSGKTTMVVERAKQMVESGIDPSTILIMTFTKKAALEMESRFKKKMAGIHIRFGTIHSVCYEIFRKEISSGVNVLSELETRNFIRQICRKEDQEEEDFNELVKNIVTEISAFRNDGQKISRIDGYQVKCGYSKEEFVRVFKEYQSLKRQNNKLDFDDILIYVDALFHKNKAALARWQEKFRYIVVDEFQDTNRLQADIIYMLAEKYQNLCVVGDDDQSIYQFRGARPEIMLGFQKQFPQAVRVDLDTNYRSGKDIIQIADNLIHKNKERFQKQFQPFRKDRGSVTLDTCLGEADMLNSLLNQIRKACKKGVPYHEMAVLYRVNYESIPVALRFMEEKIPFKCSENIRSLSRHFIFKDIQAYYRIASGVGRKPDYMRILNRPCRYLSPKCIPKDASTNAEVIAGLLQANKDTGWKAKRYQEKVANFASELGLLQKYTIDAEKFINILFSIGYKGYLKNYIEKHKIEEPLVKSMEKRVRESTLKYKGKSVGEWMDQIIYEDEEIEKTAKQADSNAVTLSTMHSAKGLEWEQVHIVNVNDETIPFIPSDGVYDEEEERRLFYVGITRARDSLFLYTDKSNKSPFLKDCGFGE